MNIRIQASRPTVKALQRRLQEAYRRDDDRLVRRIHALLEHLVYGVPVVVLSEQWGFTPACFYQWMLAFILSGLESLSYQPGGGRKAKLTPTQKKHLGEHICQAPRENFKPPSLCLLALAGICWLHQAYQRPCRKLIDRVPLSP